jgi:hypothetical protein
MTSGPRSSAHVPPAAIGEMDTSACRFIRSALCSSGLVATVNSFALERLGAIHPQEFVHHV